MQTKRTISVKWILLLVTVATVWLFSLTAFAATPSQVQNVKVSVGETSIRVYCDQAYGCNGYYIYLTDVAAKKTRTVKVSSPAAMNQKITGLKRVTNYRVQVAAYAGKTIGPKSAAVAFQTKIINPGAVKIVVYSEEQSKVQFAWTRSLLADYYELWQRIWYVDDKPKLVNNKIDIRSVTTNRLRAGFTYKFYVRGVREYKGKKYYGPFSSIVITPYTKDRDKLLAKQINTNYAYSSSTNAHKEYTKAQLEAYVNYKCYRSSKRYLVWCNTNNFHIYIFTNKDTTSGRWSLLYSTPCIIGRGSNPTPAGIFKLKGKEHWHDYGGVHAEYVTFFTGMGSNGIHSLLYPQQSDKLSAGYKYSHGCIRVPRKYAKFIYDNCEGATLVIR